jgi:hypothetical protein
LRELADNHHLAFVSVVHPDDRGLVWSQDELLTIEGFINDVSGRAATQTVEQCEFADE